MKRIVRSALSLGAALLVGQLAFASGLNHSILVEGEEDFDRDGNLGVAEDMDGDQIFGTITAALGTGMGGGLAANANQNGLLLIVTSGRFNESFTVNGLAGNNQIEAAPGVDARIDAVRAGSPDNTARQGLPGIIVDAPSNRRVVLRNLKVRNWLEGIKVIGNSRVVIENCDVDQNANYGIRCQANSQVAIDGCSVTGTGYRVGSAGDLPGVLSPAPGHGISFEEFGVGTISRSTIAQNFGSGVINSNMFGFFFPDTVRIGHLNTLGSNPDLAGKFGRLF